MDNETLQALINVYRARSSNDLFSIILDEAKGPEAQSLVLEMLRSLPSEHFSDGKFAQVRRKACLFSLKAEDFELAERLARISDLPEDKALRARALYALGRESEAATLYRQAIAEDPAIRNRDVERTLGIRPGTVAFHAAKIISLTNYSSRRENKTEQDRREAQAEAIFEELEQGAITFGDIAGLDDIKAEIRQRIILPYLKPSLFERFKQKPGGSLLIYGPPGCGKTHVARATAGETDARIITVTPDDILDKYTGEAEKRVRAFFDEARSDTPSILFFDDFDVIASPRPASNETTLALISTLLSEFDGVQPNNRGVLVIAATNVPWSIDPAFFRAGRFQRTIFVPPPDAPARRKILQASLTDVPGADKISFDRAVRRSAGYSGADVRAAAEAASHTTLTKALAGAQNATITSSILEHAIARQGPSASEWIKSARAKLRDVERDQNMLRLLSHLDRN